MITQALQAPASRFARLDVGQFIEPKIRGGLSAAEQELETELLAERGLKLIRVWNALRGRNGMSLIPIAQSEGPVMIMESMPPQEFHIDDDRIAGSDCVRFLVTSPSGTTAEKVLQKFLESLAKNAVKIV